MRIPALAVSAVAIASGLSWATMGSSGAAGGTGVYADWTVDGTSASATLSGTVFPGITAARTGGSWQVASGGSTWLSADTPFGAQYGSSRDKDYLYTSLPLGASNTVVTVTFATAAPAGTWGFALGDVDAEDITISATGTDGSSLNVSGWFQSGFNSCTVSPKPSACPAGTHTDQPTWASPVLRGSASDTNGAAAWFKPTNAVKTLTFTQARNVAGAPIYQLWIASDVISASPSAATSSASASSAATSPSPTADLECTAQDTALVNGGFERPVIPAKSYRQLAEADVPGWETTATDKKIEIWSNGFGGVDAPTADQFAELNATQPSELFQTVDTTPGQVLTWSLLHRARVAGAAGDTMSVNIGLPGSVPNATYTFTDNLSEGWVRHTGEYTVPDGQTRTRFGFESGPTASGSKSVGNFLDDIYFTTTACIPARAAEGNVVEPSPAASASQEATPTATATPTPSGSTTATESPTPTPSGSTTATSSSSPTPTPTPTPTVTSTQEETSTPEPTRTPEPVVVTPDTPTPIDVIRTSGSDPDATVTEVDEPRHGTAEIKDNTVIYTPDPGFIGRDLVVSYVKDPDGQITVVRTVVTTGLEQEPLKPLGLPASITPNRSVVLIDHAVETNADQVAKVRVTCHQVTRIAPAGGFSGCVVTRDGSTVMVTVTGSTPYRVRVSVSAPAKGDYLPYATTRTYTVRP